MTAKQTAADIHAAILRAIRAGADTKAAIERKVKASKKSVDRGLRALERAGVISARKPKKKKKRKTKARVAKPKTKPAVWWVVRWSDPPGEPDRRFKGAIGPFATRAQAEAATAGEAIWSPTVAKGATRKDVERAADRESATLRRARRNPMSAKEGRAWKARLARENGNALRIRARAKVKELRAQISAARKRGPLRTAEVRALVKRTRELVSKGARAETAAEVTRAKRELEVERADQATQTRLEKANRARSREDKYHSREERARLRRAESDGEVEANLPPEFVPLWNRVRRSIRGNERKSRTEAFLEYVAENPGEVIDAQDGGTDAIVAELEKRANAAHAFSRKRSYSEAELAAVPF
jgi:hypothetical protein